MLCFLIALVTFSIVMCFLDEKSANFDIQPIRLSAHPDFQSLLETHVMGDVAVLNENDEIGVINVMTETGDQDNFPRMKEVIPT